MWTFSEAIRAIVLLPTWIELLCLKPFFPETHPWKHKDTTFKWWLNGASDLVFFCGLGMWISGSGAAFLIVGLLIGHFK